MGKVTMIFESESKLPEGTHTEVWEVDERYMDDFEGALAAHPVYGKRIVDIMADTGQRDADGDPILGPAKQVEPTTFRDAVKIWAEVNVRDVIFDAVNKFRFAKKKAEKEAQLAAEFEPIQPK